MVPGRGHCECAIKRLERSERFGPPRAWPSAEVRDMKTLQTSQLKPNPTGKDKDKWGRASVAQLGAEWVDVKNTGGSAVNLDGVKVYHVAFVNGKPSHWELVISFTGSLGAG